MYMQTSFKVHHSAFLALENLKNLPLDGYSISGDFQFFTTSLDNLSRSMRIEEYAISFEMLSDYLMRDDWVEKIINSDIVKDII